MAKISCHPLKYLAVSYCFIDKCVKKLMKWYEKTAEYLAFLGKRPMFPEKWLMVN